MGRHDSAETGRSWATANLASPHFDEIADVTKPESTNAPAVEEQRLNSEIRYWDARAAELKQQELHGKKPRLNSGRARQRADDLEARKTRRLRELDVEADLVNHPRPSSPPRSSSPKDSRPARRCRPPTRTQAVARRRPTDEPSPRSRGAERTLGRIPVEQAPQQPRLRHPLSDPATGIVYQIEVKGHGRPTREIKVSAVAGSPGQAEPRTIPPRRRSCAHRARTGTDAFSYFIRPFDGYELHFAQTYVPLERRRPHALRRGAPVTYKKKLIEVALPLATINAESAREKSIRHGHPSTLHLWWARRPLAAARAVLWASLVDDPSAHPDRFPTDEDQLLERKRLFDILERLVPWEASNDDESSPKPAPRSRSPATATCRTSSTRSAVVERSRSKRSGSDCRPSPVISTPSPCLFSGRCSRSPAGSPDSHPSTHAGSRRHFLEQPGPPPTCRPTASGCASRS